VQEGRKIGRNGIQNFRVCQAAAYVYAVELK
jgi:hypothetical protein